MDNREEVTFLHSCFSRSRVKYYVLTRQIVFAGLNTSLAPMYISEIAPLNLRGGLGVVNQLAVTVGLLSSEVLGIEQILGNEDGWPWLFGMTSVLTTTFVSKLTRYCVLSGYYRRSSVSGSSSVDSASDMSGIASLFAHLKEKRSRRQKRYKITPIYACFLLSLQFLSCCLYPQ